MRRWPRHPLHLDVTLMPVDGPDPMASSVTGHTIDLSVGGLWVSTMGLLPLASGGADSA